MSQLILIFLPLALPFYTVRFHIGSLPTTLLEIILLISLAWWIARIKNDGWQNSLRRIGKPLCMASALWLIAGIISIFVASDRIAALGLWRAYFLEPVLVFIMLADLMRKDEDARLLLRSLALITIVLAIWAALQIYGLETIPAPWNAPPQGPRATSLFPFPNALALFSVPSAMLFFSLLLNRKKELVSPALAALAFAAGVAATFFAKSDGGLIALYAAIFVALFAWRKTRWLAVALVVISGIAVIAIPQVKQTLSDQIMFREWSGKVRLVMWDETVAMLRTRPILGAGLGAFPAAIAPYHAATWMEVFQYPHNILLNLWSETGLLGLFAFSWILFAWWRRGRKLALPVIAAILVHGIVDVPYFKNDLAVLFWILVVATFACAENKSKSQTFANCADRNNLEISENNQDNKLNRVKRVYAFWGKFDALYAAQNLITFLGRSSQIRGHAVKKLGLKNGDRVLEVACGSGNNFPYLESAIGQNGSLVGIDYSQEMLDAAARYVAQKGWHNISLLQGDAAQMTLENNAFDGVLSVLGISAIPDWEGALKKCHDTLRPGGALVVCDAKLFHGWLAFLNPLIRAVYTRYAAWDPSKNIPDKMRAIFGNVEIEYFNAGTFFIAKAIKM